MIKTRIARALFFLFVITRSPDTIFAAGEDPGTPREITRENPYELDIESIYLKKSDKPGRESHLNLESIFLSEGSSAWHPASFSEPALDIEKDLLFAERAGNGKNIAVTPVDEKAMKYFIERSQDPVGSVFLGDGRKKDNVGGKSNETTFEKVLFRESSSGAPDKSAARNKPDDEKDMAPDAARVFLGMTWSDKRGPVPGDKEPELGKIFFAVQAAASEGVYSSAPRGSRIDGENILKDPDLIAAYLTAEYTSVIRTVTVDKEPDLDKMLFAEKAAEPEGAYTNAAIRARIDAEDLLKEPDLVEAFLAGEYTSSSSYPSGDYEPDLGKMLLTERTAGPSGVYTSSFVRVRARGSSGFPELDPARVFLDPSDEGSACSGDSDKEPDVAKILLSGGSAVLSGGVGIQRQTIQQPAGSVVAGRSQKSGSIIKKGSEGEVLDLEQVLLAGSFSGKKVSGVDLEGLFLSDRGEEKAGIDLEKLFLNNPAGVAGTGNLPAGPVVQAQGYGSGQPVSLEGIPGGQAIQDKSVLQAKTPIPSKKTAFLELLREDNSGASRGNTGVVITSGDAGKSDLSAENKAPERSKQGFARGLVTEVTGSSITLEESVFDKSTGQFGKTENTYAVSEDTELSNAETFRDIELKSPAGVQYSELSGQKYAKSVTIIPQNK